MLTVHRGNRAELLAQLLAMQLRLQPPDPFEPVAVVVNTWPTSRWLGEQLAEHLGGIAANLRFPFPGSYLRQLVEQLLAGSDAAPTGADPWRADRLVWPLLSLLPAIAAAPEGAPLRHWLGERGSGTRLELAQWQLGRAMADAFDDYTLYRPDLLAAWERGLSIDAAGRPLPDSQRWQPLLYRALRQELASEPFGRRVQRLIERLRRGELAAAAGGAPLRLFGLSSMAPIQVQLLQALSLHRPVDLYLLTPCRDLWRRCAERRRQLSDALALRQPLDADWLLEAPGLEARFGRLGGEFQQLLEGTGDAQLGEARELDLFFAPARGAAPLLAQLQQQLADPDGSPPLDLRPEDRSLEFHACPGGLRQVQIVRDRLLQLLAADASLEPRDILVMTPDINAFAPLVAAAFGDADATGVELPWRLTDRSLTEEGSLAGSLLTLLELAGSRLTASGLENLLGSGPLLAAFGLTLAEGARLVEVLQAAGFRWGLDEEERSGGGGASPGEATAVNRCHSLAWACDRLLLGLVLPAGEGLAPRETAPWDGGLPLELTGRCLQLLGHLRHWLAELRRGGTVDVWAERLRRLIEDLFAGDEDPGGERPALLAAIDTWQTEAAGCALTLEAPVVAAVLAERLGAESGRFGHRSGALTISALEPMRAIPHRVIVLMGLEADRFPRLDRRPAFHLMEAQRQLGDPHPADQDRYVLMEALLSARDHLLISWSSRDDRSGVARQPAGPVAQWLQWLAAQLDPEALAQLQVSHAVNPLDPRNFQSGDGREPSSCDRRLLEATRRLAADPPVPPTGLLLGPRPAPATGAGGETPPEEAFSDLRDWLTAPQRHWLRQLGLRPGEWEKRVEDLEALALEEKERSRLLRERLPVGGEGARSGGGGPPAPREAGDWLQRHRGEGLLPPAAAGWVEAQLLQRRWSSLNGLLEALGPPRQESHDCHPWQARLSWRGSTVVLVQPARARVAHRLDLWLQLLLAAAAGAAPQQGLLIARDGENDAFGRALVLQTPEPAAARAELERLAALQREWRSRGWPVPPETGWSLVSGERKGPGKGRSAAATAWEGSGFLSGERQRPEMELCFGAGLSADDLLTPEREALASELFTPLLEAEQR